MSSVDQTIVAAALPDIETDLHTTVNWAAWTLTVANLGRVLVLPIAGRISDLYGRRRIFLLAIGLFVASSLCCSLAQSIGQLVVLRAIQAIGAAAFIPSASGLVADQFGSDRDRAVGLFTSINPIGGIAGPVLGGLITEAWSWRGIFLVNVPYGILVLGLAVWLIPRDSQESKPTRLNIDGAAILGVGSLSLMVGITLLGNPGTHLTSWSVWLPISFGTLVLWLFLHTNNRADNPFLAPKLLRGRGFAVLNLINFLYGCAALGFGALVPFYAIHRYGLSTVQSGTLLAARAVGIMLIAGLAAYTLRWTGYRWPMVFGFVITAAGLLVMASIPVDLSPYVWLSIAGGITGFGMGLAAPASNVASMSIVPGDVAAVTGLRGMFRQAGAIISVSVATAVLARSSDPGLTLGHIFILFAVIMVAVLPLVYFVPEHRGSWLAQADAQP